MIILAIVTTIADFIYGRVTIMCTHRTAACIHYHISIVNYTSQTYLWRCSSIIIKTRLLRQIHRRVHDRLVEATCLFGRFNLSCQSIRWGLSTIQNVKVAILSARIHILYVHVQYRRAKPKGSNCLLFN